MADSEARTSDAARPNGEEPGSDKLAKAAEQGDGQAALPAPTDLSAPSTYSNEMKEIEADSMTRAADDDSVDVYYIMSPLMLEQAGDAYAPLGNFHSGAAFIHKSTDVQVSLQFCATSFGVPLVVPSVDRDADELKTADGGKLQVHEGRLDFRYWRHCQKVATIKGSDYGKFVDWMQKEAKNYSKYTLAHLRATGDQVKQPFLQTWSGDSGKIGALTCFDACQNVLQAVKDIAGADAFTTDPATVFRNDLYFWMKPGTEPTKLNMTAGSLDQQRAFVFYEKMLEAVGSYQGLDVFAQLGIEIGKSGLTYAVYCDATRNYWEYTPDSIATSVEFGQEELTRLLPLLGTGAP